MHNPSGVPDGTHATPPEAPAGDHGARHRRRRRARARAEAPDSQLSLFADGGAEEEPTTSTAVSPPPSGAAVAEHIDHATPPASTRPADVLDELSRVSDRFVVLGVPFVESAATPAGGTTDAAPAPASTDLGASTDVVPPATGSATGPPPAHTEPAPPTTSAATVVTDDVPPAGDAVPTTDRANPASSAYEDAQSGGASRATEPGASADPPSEPRQLDLTAAAAPPTPSEPAQPPAPAFRPTIGEDLTPSGPRARAAANLTALELLSTLRTEQRPATPEEQRQLAEWSAWGAVPQVFDESQTDWALERARLQSLLDEEEYRSASRTTINAFYTDPALVGEMWAAVQRLGFESGRVLEPGCGSGTFIGLAPPGVQLVGVELDATTAAIAKALYPHATVRAESFADTRLPTGSFDVAIGNVPFSEVALFDPVHNRGEHSMHNHFIVKALALTRPGGIVAVITSRYTLDAQNPAARREINEMADLLGAVRLPSRAHRRAAGTDVVTDVLLLRRREPDRAPASDAWERVIDVAERLDAPRDGERRPLHVNAYFEEHPEHILGRPRAALGQFGAPQLEVIADPEEDVAGALGDVLRAITETALSSGLAYAPPKADAAAADAFVDENASGLWDGYLIARPNGGFTCVRDGRHVPHEVTRRNRAELRALLTLRDHANELLEAEASSFEDTPALAALRARARASYDRYVARYGPINRYTARRTGHTDPETGKPRMARVAPPAIRALRCDPYHAFVCALENFDETTQTAAPAMLLTKRTLAPRAPVYGVEHPDEALAVCMDTHGRIEIERVAELLGKLPGEARTALGELVYDDPESGELVPAAEYLSGDVRRKLDAAKRAAREQARYVPNVAALERVVPRDLGMEEVHAQLGAAWIDAPTHQAFLRELVDDKSISVRSPGGGMWVIEGNNHAVLSTTEWGTRRVPTPKLARAVLEQRPIQVFDKGPNDTRIFNAQETAAANEKAEALKTRFSEWVWEDSERATRLLATYNRMFNSLVLRDYGPEGERLTLPGLAQWFTPRPHQRAAVAAMLNEPAVGLFHQVGAGKTAEMVMGCMELRRLGLVSKPAIVVPNHMLEQFAREFLQLYPRARVLAASSADLKGDARRVFVARAATNDWDAIVMTRSAFERLAVSPETAKAYVAKECAELRAMLLNKDDYDRQTVKRIEAAIVSAEAQLKKRLAGEADPGITFEATGIDYLGVDEFHDYKNLRTVSNIRDAAIDGSNRASDMHMKIEYLRGQHGRRVITAMTATPIANSVTEAHVMQRYLRPDLLADVGLLTFDTWAATFGEVVTEIEMAPSGGGRYRLQSRFARFRNVPEMLRLWRVFADVKTAEDLNLPAPKVRERADGARLPETVVVPASERVRAFITRLGERAERIYGGGVDPRVDNMLKVSTDGRKAALDMRLVEVLPTLAATEAEFDDRPASSLSVTKIDVAANRIAGIWREYREAVYKDTETGLESAIRGALQLVFCDLGTPSDRWNVYDELRAQLVARGIPRQGIRFIHEARTDVEKARLFAAARAGHIAVLIGSTSKMGVGTNVQARCIALHHLDCPWRPADIEQREGRILRQGNQNAEVWIYRYIVEGSFDSYSWQTVERKARFIAQVMRGKLDVREIEDIGDMALSFAEVKALASGDPLILEKAEADAERTRLERLRRAHINTRRALQDTLTSAEGRLRQRTGELRAVEAAIASRVDTRGDAFRMVVDGQPVAERSDAVGLIKHWLARTTRPGLPHGQGERPLGHLGELGGIDIDAKLFLSIDENVKVGLWLRDVPVRPATVKLDCLDEEAATLVRQLERRLNDLPREAEELAQRCDQARRDAKHARDGLDQPFKHAQALAAAIERCEAIDAEMRGERDRPEDEATVVAMPQRHDDADDVQQAA